MTAKEVIMDGNEGYKFIDVIDNLTENDILDCMHEFAKQKCQELLLIVAEKAEIEWDGMNDCTDIAHIDKDSIFNAVDLDSFIEGTSSS